MYDDLFGEGEDFERGLRPLSLRTPAWGKEETRDNDKMKMWTGAKSPLVPLVKGETGHPEILRYDRNDNMKFWIPAFAGMTRWEYGFFASAQNDNMKFWIPACAGMTRLR